MTDTDKNIEEMLKKQDESAKNQFEAMQAELNTLADERDDVWLKDMALGLVIGLYQANATKNANPAKPFVGMDKSVSDLVADTRYIVDYLKGIVE